VIIKIVARLIKNSPMEGLDVFVGSGSNLSDVVHSPGLGLGVFLYDVEVTIMF